MGVRRCVLDKCGEAGTRLSTKLGGGFRILIRSRPRHRTIPLLPYIRNNDCEW